ncbi:LamG-like jellyroll fold domain-containing protein [Herbiconiux sp.]|uniref:LamG-like jellyroll fold domain-containing protein n=1 Tax=Herbiconiux sp. TaxID=1871186 RepID=UPI0025C72F6A|nr:LamG-like jellyroll fold domain-containing protein [Herbiconiux sp.]
MTPALAAPADHLVAHYDFDGSPLSSSVLTDRSTRGNDATIVNGSAATVVEGQESGSSAILFPGGAQSSNGTYVELPPNLIGSAESVTVSATIELTDNTSAWQWLFGIGTNTQRYLFTTPRNDSGVVRSAVTTNYGGGEAKVTGSAPIPSGKWSTVTVTLDSEAHTLTSYLDGVAIGSATTDVTANELVASGASGSGYIGKSFYNDPLFAGAIDDFAVYDTALTADEVKNIVGGSVPTVTGVPQSSFALTTTAGTAPALPATVQASFSDGFDRAVPATWDAVDPAAYAQRGSFQVKGVAEGVALTASVRVIVAGDLTIDLGTDTGPFHGGASGTLYGLYGPGLPSDNLIEGMKLRTVATKAQDGPQHPGADALEVVKPLADATNGDTYIYMTDINRGFPYEWEGSTPEEKLSGYMAKMETEVDQVLTLDKSYQDNIVFVPFNEPEGNMFGTGEWSYDGTNWLDDPTDYFAAWDAAYRMIKQKMPDARIAGPNTERLWGQIQGFLEHTVEAGTVPQVMTWHELSDPASLKANVQVYRGWEQRIFAGTDYAGTQLPINIDEYAFNYHTSVPGQMIQWIAGIEDSKVDADIAYWNIDGNLSDSAVESNRGNGQWWLLNAYGQMSGHTVSVTPPTPGQSYTLQGVSTLDEDAKQARALFGGTTGNAYVQFANVDPSIFGDTVHALVQRIDWSGQIGDNSGPATVAELDLPVIDGSVGFDFGNSLPALDESSAYQVILSPGAHSTEPQVSPTLWKNSYEAENAAHSGSGYSVNGREGSPADVSKFYTSGGYDVGGLRTGSDVTLDFTVDVPQDGTYDLSVFANSLNTYDLVQEQGPPNIFLTVDGTAEQELFMPLGYKWVVWDHTDTTVQLSAGQHTLRLAARSLDGTRSTKGDTILDKIDLSLANPAAGDRIYEAENATLGGGASADYSRDGASGAGVVSLARGASATFWVYSATDGESTLALDTFGGGTASVAVNGLDYGTVGESSTQSVFLVGGINKITVTGTDGALAFDRLRVTPGGDDLAGTSYEAESAVLSGTATASDLSLASGGKAVTGVGGAPGNGNTLTFQNVTVPADGTYAMTVRFSNQEQSPASHYNPDPLARPADISVNGAPATRVLFPHSFHQNEFWDQTVFVQLNAGTNSVRFSSEEQPNFDGTSYISDTWKGILLRSAYAPNIDKITVTPVHPGTAAPTTASIELGNGAAKAGDRLAVSGAGFAEGDTVTLTLHSDPIEVGTATVAADGTFETTITIPADTVAGAHRIVATASPSGRSAEAAITVTAAGGGGGTTGGGTSGGDATGGSGPAPSSIAGSAQGSASSAADLAHTGAAVAPWVALALLLFGIGGLLMLHRRRAIRRG